jgi:hypothetical protein
MRGRNRVRTGRIKVKQGESRSNRAEEGNQAMNGNVALFYFLVILKDPTFTSKISLKSLVQKLKAPSGHTPEIVFCMQYLQRSPSIEYKPQIHASLTRVRRCVCLFKRK